MLNSRPSNNIRDFLPTLLTNTQEGRGDVVTALFEKKRGEAVTTKRDELKEGVTLFEGGRRPIALFGLCLGPM